MRDVHQRQAFADPQDIGAAVKDVQSRARIEGPDVYLEPTLDLSEWAKAKPPVQDMAIIEVSRRLSPAYKHVETKIYACGGQRYRIATFCHERTGIELNLIPGGKFMMGGTEYMDEQPVHEVHIERPILAGKYPVTQNQWDAIGGDDNRESQSPFMPINGVSWNNTQTWLIHVGDGLRLPSEAEWEYVCRAGTNSNWCFGDDKSRLDDYGHCTLSSSLSNVGTKLPNAFGLHDVHGNVAELCQDGWLYHYYEGRSQGPVSTASGARVVRGGGWCDTPGACRSAYRWRAGETTESGNVGFRVFRYIPMGRLR